jgi:hypothetical protein
MIYPLLIIISMIVYGKLPIVHPFIVVNGGLITMGAGLSKTEWLFYIGVVVSLLFSIYSVLMLPTKEALKALNETLDGLSKNSTPVNLLGKIRQHFKKS